MGLNNKKLIFISEVSILIGRLNRNLVKTFEDVFRRLDYNGYNMYKNNIKNKLEINTKELSEENKKINNEYEKCILTKEEYIEKKLGTEILKLIQSEDIDIKKKKEDISKIIIEKDIDNNDNNITKITDSIINTKYGTLKEEDAIKIYERQIQTKIIRKQEITISHLTDDYYIYGKIDGVDNKDNALIEIKNRINYLFKHLRDYEKVQIQLYMYSTNIKSAKLIEKYNNDINIIENIELDMEYINNILNNLEIFINKMESFISDDNIKNEYINLITENEKENFLHNYYLKEIIAKKKI
jgi:hypothetical protein